MISGEWDLVNCSCLARVHGEFVLRRKSVEKAMMRNQIAEAELRASEWSNMRAKCEWSSASRMQRCATLAISFSCIGDDRERNILLQFGSQRTDEGCRKQIEAVSMCLMTLPGIPRGPAHRRIPDPRLCAQLA